MKSITVWALAACLVFCGAAWSDDAVPVVADSAEEVKPLEEGATAPDVSFEKADGSSVKLRALVAEKPAVLVFFRGGWCPFCTKHLSAMRDVVPELNEMGYQVLAISPDTVEEDKAIAEKHELNYTLLSDAGLEASKQFGLVFKMDPETVEKYKGYKIDLDDTGWSLPVPTVLIVDKDGVIQFQHSEADYKERLAPADVLQAAKDAMG